MKAYRIVDWERLYEVDIKGHAVKPYEKPLPLDKLRKAPLQYIRFENTGHSLTATERRINEKAWRAGEIFEMAVRGLYKELVILAANQPRSYRGWILDNKQKPLNIKGIAEILGLYEIERVRAALGILTDPDIDLVELCELGQTSGKVRTIPDESGLFKKETENNVNINEEDSGFSVEFSDSVSKEAVEVARQKAALSLAEIFRVINKSDGTTFRHILDQLESKVISGELEVHIFGDMVKIAKECGCGNIGMFVKAMKRHPFGYVPVRKQVFKELSF